MELLHFDRILEIIMTTYTVRFKVATLLLLLMV